MLLRVISEEKYYHKLLVKFGILELVSNIIEITDHDQEMEDEKEAR